MDRGRASDSPGESPPMRCGLLVAARFTTFTAVRAAAVGENDPQRLVDGQVESPEADHRAGDAAAAPGAVVDAGDVERVVVDEAAQLVAERLVHHGVGDDLVPPDVHERRRGVRDALAQAAGLECQERQRLVHDALREGERHALVLFVLDDAGHQTVPRPRVDLIEEVTVGESDSGRLQHCRRKCNSHGRSPSVMPCLRVAILSL